METQQQHPYSRYPPVVEEEEERRPGGGAFDHDGEDDVDDAATDPTPVPTTYRPPPPHQQQQQQQHEGGGPTSVATVNNRSLLENTLFSFSIDGTSANTTGGGTDTLPSLALDPPSPLSKPSESLLGTSSIDNGDNGVDNIDDENGGMKSQTQYQLSYKTINGGAGTVGASGASKTPSLRERRQRLQQRSTVKKPPATTTTNSVPPPIEEVHVDHLGAAAAAADTEHYNNEVNNHLPTEQHNEQNPIRLSSSEMVMEVVEDDGDEFYDSFERVATPQSTTTPRSSSSPPRSYLATPDGPANMPHHPMTAMKGLRTLSQQQPQQQRHHSGEEQQQEHLNEQQPHAPKRDTTLDSLTISSDSFVVIQSPPAHDNDKNQHNYNHGKSLAAQKRLETSKASNRKSSRQTEQQQQQDPYYTLDRVSIDDVVRVHEASLSSLQKLSQELSLARQQNTKLEQDQQLWLNERHDLKVALEQAEREKQQAETNFHRQLAMERDRLESSKVEWKKQQETTWATEKRQLETQLRESRTKDQKEYMHRKIASDNRHKELKLQIDRLRTELEETLSAKANLAADLAKSESERIELETDRTSLRKQHDELILQRDEAAMSVRKLQDQVRDQEQKLREAQESSTMEMERLNKSLRKSNETIHRLRSELSSATQNRSLSSKQWGSFGGRNGITTMPQSTTHHVYGGNSSIRERSGMMSQTPDGSAGVPVLPETLDTAIADRLARLRDSAERAHLVKAHKRDIAKFKADRDALIQKLEADHEAALKKVTKQAESRREADMEAITKKLKNEYETKLEEVEETHRKRLSDLQKDYLKLQEDSEESIQDAISRSNTSNQQYERESARRVSAEKALQDLQRQVEADKEASQVRHADELEKRRQEWEVERDTMLVLLQKDCNTVFDSRRTTWTTAGQVGGGRTPSPRQHPHPAPPSSLSYPHQQSRSTPLSTVNTVFFPSTNDTPYRPETNTAAGAGMSRTISTIADAGVGGATNPTNLTSSYTPSPGGIGGGRPSPRSDGSASGGIGVSGGSGVIGAGIIGGSPSMVSQTYSDLDSILRETEEFVQSVI